MIDGLPAVLPFIHEQAETIMVKAEVLSDFFCDNYHPAQYLGIAIIYSGQFWDLFTGYDQNMNRCLRIDIFKGNNLIIFIDYFRRFFFVDDLAEYGFFFHANLPEVLISQAVNKGCCRNGGCFSPQTMDPKIERQKVMGGGQAFFIMVKSTLGSY